MNLKDKRLMVIGGGGLIGSRTVDELLDEHVPTNCPHDKLIAFVIDRLGYDRRCTINAKKMEIEHGWQSLETFKTGIRKTVEWYIE